MQDNVAVGGAGGAVFWQVDVVGINCEGREPTGHVASDVYQPNPDYSSGSSSNSSDEYSSDYVGVSFSEVFHFIPIVGWGRWDGEFFPAI